MKKLAALLTKKKGNVALIEWVNDGSDIFRALYGVYEKIKKIFFHA